ncbi:unnamed protein product, partial [Polarella glacialis]
PKALFLDYDGTLREFEARPELAVPTDEIMALLRALNDRVDLEPHIISGRDTGFLEEHFGGLERFTLIAEHGFKILPPSSQGVDRTWRLGEDQDDSTVDHDSWKAIMRTEIMRLVDANPRSHMEEKYFSLVWHFREIDDE